VTSTPPGPLVRQELGSPLVLIVDDNEKNRKLASDVLRAAGLRTLEAPTGTKGIALAEKHAPDVVLLDLELPDMDGADVLHELRRREGTAGLPIVAVSARYGVGEWAHDAGFDGFIEKPIRVADFPDQVRQLSRPAAR
jgi:two-component system, cell cycle response regulator DivK